METTKIRIALDAGALCPTRAHSLDAGLDLYTNTYGKYVATMGDRRE